jgi:hypothetical protein
MIFCCGGESNGHYTTVASQGINFFYLNTNYQCIPGEPLWLNGKVME